VLSVLSCLELSWLVLSCVGVGVPCLLCVVLPCFVLNVGLIPGLIQNIVPTVLELFQLKLELLQLELELMHHATVVYVYLCVDRCKLILCTFFLTILVVIILHGRHLYVCDVVCILKTDSKFKRKYGENREGEKHPLPLCVGIKVLERNIPTQVSVGIHFMKRLLRYNIIPNQVLAYTL
jgi:hypothetical protein